jgi:hypothetical protein
MTRFTLYVMLLAGCPAPNRYVITDVVSYQAPVEDAMVAARCGTPYGSALRTDHNGRARLAVRGEAEASQCVLTVAKPGYSTVEVEGVNICSTPTGCPAMRIELPVSRAGGAPTAAPPPGDVAPVMWRAR